MAQEAILDRKSQSVALDVTWSCKGCFYCVLVVFFSFYHNFTVHMPHSENLFCWQIQYALPTFKNSWAHVK